MLFTDHDYTFLNWIQNLEKKVQKLIYEKRETWFGGDDDDSNNEWVGSDFEYANDLYQDARMGTGHIVTDLIASYDAYTERRKADSTFLSDTLNDVAAWFAADEAADAQDLADTINDMQARYDAMLSHYQDSVAYTLDSAAVAFAALDRKKNINFGARKMRLWTVIVVFVVL